MKLKESIYVGGGILESDLLWIFPVLKALIKKKKINSIIIENLQGKVVTLEYIYKILPDCKIVVIKNKSSLNKIYRILLLLVVNFLQIFKYFYLLNNKNIFCNNWTDLQMRHSMWDSAIGMMNDCQEKPSRIQIFLSVLLSLNSFIKAKNLISKYNIKIAVLGHSVYQHRSFLACLRKNKIKILSHAVFNLHWQKFYDSSWNIIDKKLFKRINKVLIKRKIDDYWRKRFLGGSNYEDANVASNISNKISIYPKNVILLHIFKDSPFNIIDKERIFTDYFDWINNTLSIISESKEQWSLRLHPNSKRWGENQKLIIKMLLKKHPILLEKGKVLIDDKLVSNSFLFNNVKRVVTFSGTSHLEASCCGIKPIAISKTMLSALNSKLIFKPKNFTEYKKLILCPSENKIFRQDEKAVTFSKKLLFIRENILTLKNDLRAQNIYRNDSKVFRNSQLKNIKNNLNKNLKNLEFLGEKISGGLTHSIANDYLRLI